ncbi:MAG: hypothetical protein AAGA85_09410 [Bacteroidota bacterium]
MAFTEKTRLALLTLFIPVALFALLAPYSLLVGWNFFSAVLFWFIVIPATTVQLPKVLKVTRRPLGFQIIGLLFFYGFIHFLIYEHSQTDLYQVMMTSCLFNLIAVGYISLESGYQGRNCKPDTAQ